MSCTTSLTGSFGAANVEAESPASSKPSKIPLLPPPHALLELVLCNEGRGKKKKRPREQKGREPRRWPWAARLSSAGGVVEGDCMGL